MSAWWSAAGQRRAGSAQSRGLRQCREPGDEAAPYYTMQVGALKRHRSAGEHRVVVQQVNVSADQATVQVNAAAPRGRGLVRNWRNEAMESNLSMHQSPRCGAGNRQGMPCQSLAVKGWACCRSHGGAEGSGAQLGNQNALKHGRYTAEAIARRREVAALLRTCREQLDSISTQPRSTS